MDFPRMEAETLPVSPDKEVLLRDGNAAIYQQPAEQREEKERGGDL